MTLEKNNDLGKISVSDELVLDVIHRALQKEETREKIWLSEKHGRLMRAIPGVPDKSALDSFDIEESSDGMELSLDVIVSFGSSIKKLTRFLADEIRARFLDLTGIWLTKITLNIDGVKSKKVAKRNTKVVYKYEGE